MSLSFSIFEEQRTLLALPALDPGAWVNRRPYTPQGEAAAACRLLFLLPVVVFVLLH